MEIVEMNLDERQLKEIQEKKEMIAKQKLADEQKKEEIKKVEEVAPQVEENGQPEEKKKRKKNKKKKNKGIADFMEDAEEAKAFQEAEPSAAPIQEKENTNVENLDEAPQPSKKEEKI